MDRPISSGVPRASRRVILLVIFVLLGYCFPAALAHAEDALINDVIITPVNGELLLYCRVKNCFTKDMNRAILSGISTTFTFRVLFSAERDLWFDRELANLRVHHTIKYNALKNEFALTRTDENGVSTSSVVREFYKAKAFLTDLEGVKLAPLSDLDPKATYRLLVRAQLNKVRLPFYMHYILFFVSLWDFETDWYEIRLTYEGNPLGQQ